MTKFVFDANVVIGFHTINYLDTILKKLRELSDRVYMDENNVHELTKKSGYTQKTLLSSSGIFEEILPDETDFEKFKIGLNKNKIFLSVPDMHVLYLAKKKKADYVVSFDQTVLRKAKKVMEMYGIKYMNPISNVELIYYLFVNGKIEFDNYMKVVLEYFKYVEMDNIFNAITNPNRSWDLKAVRERFQLYKDPLLDSLEERVDGAQAKVSMYG